MSSDVSRLDVAIVGMAGRFPGAETVDELWRNLRQGVESISTWPKAECERSPLDPDLLDDPNLVAAAGLLNDIEYFDPSFFGLTANQAKLMDPQHRVFLECAWEALETAGFDANRFTRSIGVYASSTISRYLYLCLSTPGVTAASGLDLVSMGNNLDFLATLVSYKLNLTGPSYAVQTACSSSLVAVHVAVQALLAHECEMALAGGVSIRVPQRVGYRHEEGGIVSPDGHCRPFDADARGTVFGNGAGVVVLQRLEEALACGSTIRAVIKGSAINNDGSAKVGFTAPSVVGQAAVILEAQANASIAPETIGYVEAHGTGTAVGDPIEVEALTQAFRARTDRTGISALGSVKANIGHLDAGAGVAGLIKTVLMLDHREIPPTVHFRRPNPRIDLARSPFYVNSELRAWECAGVRRAGVSSFGIGGTNAHVIVEEAPEQLPGMGARPWQMLTVSAQTSEARERATRNLVERVRGLSGEALADAAYTAHVGRKAFPHRGAIVCRDGTGAERAWRESDNPWTVVHEASQEPPAIAFLFPGQGALRPGVGTELYRTERAFAEQIDQCLEILCQHTGKRHEWECVLLQGPGQQDLLRQTRLAQPALFTLEYALAKVWMKWGVEPRALLGHSLGEYVAACLSGIFDLEGALTLVADRGALAQQTPPGAMLAIGLAEDEVREWIDPEIDLAAVNGVRSCVVAGPSSQIQRLAARLDAAGVWQQALDVERAFHSRLMDPVMAQYAAAIDRRRRAAPAIPIASAVTGGWLTGRDAQSTRYWLRHLREPVRFAAALEALGRGHVLVEVGPSQTLRGLAAGSGLRVFSSMPADGDARSELAQWLSAAGALWTLGAPLDWQRFYAGQRRRRVPLPTYPFERQRCWLPTPTSATGSTTPSGSASTCRTKQNFDKWFYVPSWKRSLDLLPSIDRLASGTWLVFLDEQGLGEALVRTLERSKHRVLTVSPGSEFVADADGRYTVRPDRWEDYEALVAALAAKCVRVSRVLHCWGAAGRSHPNDGDERQTIDRSFYSLLWLARAFDRPAAGAHVELYVITSEACQVVGLEDVRPAASMVGGLSKVIPQECSGLECRQIDLPRFEGLQEASAWVDRVLAEVSRGSGVSLVAYRGTHRWVPTWERSSPCSLASATPAIRQRGVYLIVGGLGRFGLIIANYLAREARARIVLTSRSPFPETNRWEEWVDRHPEDDVTSRRIRGLQSILTAGGELRIVDVDVADEWGISNLIASIERDFGALNGIIHAAGHTGRDTHRAIHDMTRAECEEVFAAKIAGLGVLARAVAHSRLDFCMLTSSLSPILGGLGLAAYSAAHHYMDTFAEVMRRRYLPWTSVNWEGWARHSSQSIEDRPGRAVADLTMTEEEIERCFDLVLRTSTTPRIVIATADLQSRINQWVIGLRTAGRLASEPTSSRTQDEQASPAAEARPLRSRNVSAQDVLEIAASILGVPDLDVHDNLFDRGANSLIAVQLIARLRREFQRFVPLAELFEHPSAAALAEAINSAEGISAGAVDIEEAVREIEELSPDDAKALLHASAASAGTKDVNG
jgi:acyl transferase domain-containing protein